MLSKVSQGSGMVDGSDAVAGQLQLPGVRDEAEEFRRRILRNVRRRELWDAGCEHTFPVNESSPADGPGSTKTADAGGGRGSG